MWREWGIFKFVFLNGWVEWGRRQGGLWLPERGEGSIKKKKDRGDKIEIAKSWLMSRRPGLMSRRPGMI